jgi:sulfite exporter TauE/SafE
MRAVGWMVGLSVASALAASLVLGAAQAPAVFLGMLAPLLAVTTSWIAMERTYRRHPERVTAVMMGAFGAKMVFFGVYLAVVLKVVKVEPGPFVASFTAYFIALYLVQAVGLQRLFAHR